MHDSDHYILYTEYKSSEVYRPWSPALPPPPPLLHQQFLPCLPDDKIQSCLMSVRALDYSGLTEALKLGDGVLVAARLLVIVVGNEPVERTYEIHGLSRLWRDGQKILSCH